MLPVGLLHAQDTDDTIEYSENGTDPVATYNAVDPEGAAITSWTLSGDDADDFMIDGGVLSFAKSPDYEAAADEGTDNTYEVTVQATDESNKVGMHEVTVEVTNVDEPGTVTLSALRPQSQTMFNATLTDPDGAASGTKWQWAKSSSRNGTYSDIEDAIASSYTPQDADNGSYLRVTATYTDPEGSDKSAMATSANKVQAVRGDNNAPVFPDQDPDTDGDQSTTATREVAENTAAGQAIGDPVVAEDEDGDILTYTLSGTDADSFAIDWATGQLMTKAALDEETEPSYTVVVRATDPAGIPQAPSAVDANSDEITVTITVTDVNEPPAITGDAAATFEEVAGDITTPLDTYDEDDPETNDPSTWSVAGDDSSKFDISTNGALTFKAKPDFEAPTDANGDNVYEVTVRAADGDGNRGEMAVKVTVQNEDEDGAVSLSRTQIRVGVPVTASLSDPDGSISGLSWQWSISSGAATTAQGDIEDANSDTYTPVAGDVGGTLTATASYTDGHGSSKDAELEATNPVVVDTRNREPVFEDQDAETDGVQNESTTRKVAENTKALAGSDDDDAPTATDATADNVGSVVTATDPDPNTEALIYTLGGDDADKFRVRSNGQIEVGAGTKLDYETRDTYMVTVMAEDSFGESASIMVTITVTDVDEAPEITEGAVNTAPEFANPTAERMVAENTAAGENIGAPVVATDADDDTLTYTMSGADAASFGIGPTTGQLTTKTDLDFETKASYTVTVSATDAAGLSDAITVTINVTDVDENLPPEFPSAATTREVAENTVAGEDIGAPVAAIDADDDTLTYTMSGTDAASFGIGPTTGQLTTKTDLDFETKASYTVTVSATDAAGLSDAITVTINVTNVDEPITPEPETLLERYDTDNSGAIDKGEVIAAINDYLDSVEGVSKKDVIDVINLYLDS